ncbi:carbohydrate kinase [Roseibium denhamense]|uniref:Fructokinase n=1 Tax=Roseibium denhamense TaxID=76305 RepID=A0ABY1N965_9HYPH|nr:carbohydrate kinase [Roseibium denhamense]MTI05659.1 carbohydrate kinase [Roseibium denhamense]SMP03865.1 fructokinase [Roseibium denhamense]
MFLVCGEALFDLFGEDTSATSLSFDARIGGSPYNVALGLARLEEDAAFFGGISRDVLGEKLVAKLADEGVSGQHILRIDYLTTLSIVQKNEDGVPAYTFYGDNAADRMVTSDDLPDFAGTPPEFIHIGSYTALVEPVSQAYRALIERERTSCLIAFDPNIRPTVVSDMKTWRRNTESLVPLCDVIKVSDEDLDLIAPGEPVENVARTWLAKGAKLVVVTKGAEGASAFTMGIEVSIPGIKVKVEDTVGAGDTFQAALLAGLKTLGITNRPALAALDEGPLTRLLQLCAQAAAVTCSRRGADLPRRAELEKEIASLK